MKNKGVCIRKQAYNMGRSLRYRPKVIVMTGFGINSEEETQYVFEKAGATAEIVHVNDLIDGHKKLSNYQIMAFPGGFAHGDDTGSGNAYANKMRNNVWDQVRKFVTQDKLVIGICNGCQIIANLGLVPGFDGKYGERLVALRHNASARYECRWINMKVTSKKCVWTRDMDIIRCPVSHGEGNFYAETSVLKRLNKDDQIVFRYVDDKGKLAGGKFPINPNGAPEDIAAISDPTGRILAVMPHPERNWNFYNQDNWTMIKEQMERNGVSHSRNGLYDSARITALSCADGASSAMLPCAEGQGMKMFRNAVEYFVK